MSIGLELANEVLHAPVTRAALCDGLGRLLADPHHPGPDRRVGHDLLHLLPDLLPGDKPVFPVPAPVLHPHADAATHHNRGVHTLVAAARPREQWHASGRCLRHRVPPAVTQEQPHGGVLEQVLLVDPSLHDDAAPLHTLQEPGAEQVAELGVVVAVDGGGLEHPQEPAAARLQPGGDLPDLLVADGDSAAERDVHHRTCRLLVEPGDDRGRACCCFVCILGAVRPEQTDGVHRREAGDHLAVSQRGERHRLQGVERVDKNAVGFGEGAAIVDELLGEELLQIEQRLREPRLRDAAHAGDVDVADAAGCRQLLPLVEVDGEVGDEREHGRAGDEEYVARDVDLLADGDDVGGQRHVSDDGGGAGDERAEEVRVAAQGLPAEQERVVAREHGGVTERREVAVDAADARERREEAGEVVGLGGRHRRQEGHDGDVDAAAAREVGDKAEEGQQVAHAGAWDEHHVRCAAVELAGALRRPSLLWGHAAFLCCACVTAAIRGLKT
ncbi:hypothetical protein EJB05_45200, partial [Eragrostis curvula]